MKIITLPLVSGHEATFFLSNSNLVVIANKDKKTCTICDNVHNNGGWEINQPYEKVIATLMKAFN
jgi:hypothetical protein